MSVVALVRLACFGFLLVCSLVVLGITANFIALGRGNATSSTGLGLAVSVITLVTITPALVIGLIRQGSFVTMVSVELGVVGLLWVLWLATGAQVSNVLGAAGSVDCSIASIFGSEFVSICHQGQAFQAFSWLAWIDLTIYLGLLISLSITATTRGNTNIWTQSVVDADFLAPSANKNVHNVNNNNPAMMQQQQQPQMMNQQYPPQQQLYTQPAAQPPQIGAGGYQSPQITGGSGFQSPQPTPGAIHV